MPIWLQHVHLCIIQAGKRNSVYTPMKVSVRQKHLHEDNGCMGHYLQSLPPAYVSMCQMTAAIHGNSLHLMLWPPIARSLTHRLKSQCLCGLYNFCRVSPLGMPSQLNAIGHETEHHVSVHENTCHIYDQQIISTRTGNNSVHHAN